MKQQCKICGANCENGEFCFRHKPRKAMPKQSFKRSVVPQEIDTRMWDLFLEIWNERDHYSEVSGKFLGHEPLTYFFDHLLEKHKYPEIKYEKGNIILVTFEEHDKKGMGFPLHRHQQLIERAEKQFLPIKKPGD